MAQLLGKIIFAIVATVIVAVVLTLVVGLFSTLVGLVGLAIKVAVIAGLIYLVWLIFKKLTQSTA
jgi:threonine/homoserine/homoserine lactone efflux protein